MSETELNLVEFNENLENLKKSFERAKEENLYAVAEIAKLKPAKLDLEYKLSESTSKITELETKIQASTQKDEMIEKEKSDLRTKLEKEKEDLKNELNQKERENESLKKELKETVSDKDAEIENLKKERGGKTDELSELKQKIKSLEETLEGTISEAKGAPQLLEEINNILIHKGFLSDREFEDILQKLDVKILNHIK